MKPNYLTNSRLEIEHWEKRGPGWLSHISDFVLWPAQKAAGAFIPKGISEQVGKAIEYCLNGAAAVSGHTINFAEIHAAVKKACPGDADLPARMAAADKVAKSLWNRNLAYVAGEGAATGAVGLAGLAADIPALFTLVMRMIQQIGTCYGYDMTQPGEREYILQILRTASAGELTTKLEALLLLKEIEQILLSMSWKKIGTAVATKQLSKLSVLAATRQLAKSLGMDLTKRKALQIVPLVGALVGASFNATFANEVGEAAFMSYRRRWLAENGLPHDTSAQPPVVSGKTQTPLKVTGRPRRVNSPIRAMAKSKRPLKIPQRSGSK